MRMGLGMVTGLIGIIWLIGPEPFRKLKRWFLNK